MKQNVNPVVAAIVIIVAVALAGFFIYRGTSGVSKKQAESIEKTIQSGLAGGGLPPGIAPQQQGPQIQVGAPMPGTPGQAPQPARR